MDEGAFHSNGQGRTYTQNSAKNFDDEERQAGKAFYSGAIQVGLDPIVQSCYDSENKAASKRTNRQTHWIDTYSGIPDPDPSGAQ